MTLRDILRHIETLSARLNAGLAAVALVLSLIVTFEGAVILFERIPQPVPPESVIDFTAFER